jgi:Amt family ammonium transporter
LYGTLNGSNVSELVRNVTIVGSLITFLWILFSFSLAYGEDAKGNGIIGFPKTYYFFDNTFDKNASANGAGEITNSIFAVYELGFALVTATLVTISLAGRVNLNSFLIFMFAWHLVVYTPVAHIVWANNGALLTNWVQDFSGSLVVHILSSATAISLHLVLGKDEIPKAGPVANPEKAFYLSFVVWFLWFGFTAGKAHDANPVATQSVVNTIAATFSAILMSFFYHLVLEKAITPVSLANAILIGLVSITPASGFVTVGGAMVIAIFTYLFTAVVAMFFIGEGFNAHESFSTLTIHSVAGTVGYIWTAILSYHMINPAGYNGLTAGRGIPLSYQLAGLLAVWTCSFISTFVLAWVVNLVAPLKVTQGYEADYKAPEAAQPEKEAAHNEGNVELTQV